MVGKKLLIYRANKLAKKKVSAKSSLSYSEANSVGIVFTTEDLAKHQYIKDFIKKLKANGKNVEVLCYLPKGQENHEFIFNFFTEQDISIFGKFTNPEVIRFLAHPFDFLFCLDCNPNPIVEAIMGNTRANCRVGCYKKDKDHFYELMINPKKMSTENLIDEIFRYTKVLK